MNPTVLEFLSLVSSELDVVFLTNGAARDDDLVPETETSSAICIVTGKEQEMARKYMLQKRESAGSGWSIECFRAFQ